MSTRFFPISFYRTDQQGKSFAVSRVLSFYFKTSIGVPSDKKNSHRNNFSFMCFIVIEFSKIHCPGFFPTSVPP